MEEVKPVPENGLVPKPLPEILYVESSESLHEGQPQNDIPMQPYLETPQTSHAPSESDSTQPTTPSSAVTPAPPRQQSLQTVKTSDRATVAKVPIVPAIPNIPLASRPSKRASVSVTSDAKRTEHPSPSDTPDVTNAVETAGQSNKQRLSANPEITGNPTSPPAKTAPKSWADLVKTMAQPTTTNANKVSDNTHTQTNGFSNPRTGSLADALGSFSIYGGSEESRLSFLEPRGLVNTGNMCYMNAVSRCHTTCYSAHFYPLIQHSRFFKY